MINQINLDDLMTARSVIGYTIQSQFQSINKASDEVIKILCDEGYRLKLHRSKVH